MTPPGRRRLQLSHVDAAAALVIAGFIAVATLAIDRPGLEYDETLFVNAATGAHAQMFVEGRVLGFPVLLLSYIGALKAYIYYPIFLLFGVSPLTVRLPAILIAALALWITFRLARMFLNDWAAVLLLLVVASEPALIFLSKGDYGPAVLMTLFKVTALYALFKYLRDGRVRYLVLLCASLLLGLYDKLNFVWFIVALAIAVPLTLWPEVRRAPGLRSKRAAALIGATAVVAIGYTAALLPHALRESGTNSSGGVATRVGQTIALFRHTFDGSEVFAFMTGSRLGFAAWTPMLTLAAMVAAGLAAVVWLAQPAQRRALRPRLRVTLFFLVLIAVMFAQMAATPARIGAHHMIMLWGLSALALFTAVRALARMAHPSRQRTLAGLAGTALVLGLVATQAVADAEYAGAFTKPTAFSSPWTPAIYPLSVEVERELSGAGEVVVVDWGIGNQLCGLANPDGRRRYLDEWQDFRHLDVASLAAMEQLSHRLFDGRRAFAVVHTPAEAIYPDAQSHFFTMASATGLSLHQQAVVNDPSGQPTFIIYSVSSSG